MVTELIGLAVRFLVLGPGTTNPHSSVHRKQRAEKSVRGRQYTNALRREPGPGDFGH